MAVAGSAGEVRLSELVRWLEEDGHAGCAADLEAAAPGRRAEEARRIAEHVEEEAHYDDSRGRALPVALRDWAAAQERPAPGESDLGGPETGASSPAPPLREDRGEGFGRWQ